MKMNLLYGLVAVLGAYLASAVLYIMMYLEATNIFWFAFYLVLFVVSPVLALLSAMFLVTVTVMYVVDYLYPERPIPDEMAKMIKFKDTELESKYAGRAMPIQVFYEAYMNESLDVVGDMYTLLKEHRHKMFRFTFTLFHVKYVCLKLIPQALWHSKSMDEDEVKTVYNRGNDFYSWFLGPSMVYTSGVYKSLDDTLEEAQSRKLDFICEKLQLQEGESLLDIGCGWGGLVRRACQKFKVKALGVTISREQVDYANEAIKKEDLGENCKVELLDYRDIPQGQWDKISCVEMAEHVGVLRFQNFLHLVKNRLKDDGKLYMQIAGLRAAWQFEDLIWGMFMGTYIFPAADASCPLWFVVSQLESAGFEIQHVQNIGIHYSRTIKQWYDNWLANEDAIVAKYGQWWFRLWVVFLSWSSIIASQGSSTCWQIVCHKNLDKFDRTQYVGKPEYGVPVEDAKK